MSRRALLKAIGSAALLPILTRRLSASAPFRRRRPSDTTWPSKSAWKQLDEAVGGNLISVNSPLSLFKTDPASAAAKRLSANLKNPYYIGDEPGLTQTLGWIDAWATKPSVYAVAARNVHDIAEAVNFARDNDLRLVVKFLPRSAGQTASFVLWLSIGKGSGRGTAPRIQRTRTPGPRRSFPSVGTTAS